MVLSSIQEKFVDAMLAGKSGPDADNFNTNRAEFIRCWESNHPIRFARLYASVYNPTGYIGSKKYEGWRFTIGRCQECSHIAFLFWTYVCHSRPKIKRKQEENAQQSYSQHL